MATDDYQNEISKMLQCSICLEILDNPKGLICQHSFCKKCLDDLLQFRKNGGAVITCPLRCKRQTFLTRNQTTNDLPTPYQLKGILELHAKQHTSSHIVDCHCNADNCRNPPSSCCTQCYKLFCSSCQEVHSISHSLQLTNSYIPIKYNNTLNKYEVVCDKHSAAGNYLCNCIDNTFICIYCKQREHQKHQVIDVRERATEIKEKLNGDGLSTILCNTFSVSKQRETYIPECRTLLMETLWIRKLKELSCYLTHLNDEELRLMRRFDTLASAHLRNYNDEDKKSVVEFVEKILQNEDFQIVLKEKYVMDIFAKYSNITSVKLNLSEKQGEKCPLGDLSLKYDIFNDIGKEDINCKFSHNLAVISDVGEEIKKLMENLNNMLPDVHLVRNMCTKSDLGKDADTFDLEGRCCYNEEFQSAALMKLENEGLSYVENLIKQNQVEIMKMILSIRPEIVEMKDVFSTPLLYAVKYNNLPIYKLLLEHGAHVSNEEVC